MISLFFATSVSQSIFCHRPNDNLPTCPNGSTLISTVDEIKSLLTDNDTNITIYLRDNRAYPFVMTNNFSTNLPISIIGSDMTCELDFTFISHETKHRKISLDTLTFAVIRAPYPLELNDLTLKNVQFRSDDNMALDLHSKYLTSDAFSLQQCSSVTSTNLILSFMIYHSSYSKQLLISTILFMVILISALVYMIYSI